MNVFITDKIPLYVSRSPDGANVNVYRMFEAVLVIFTNAMFL
jgi:hypothetical protein